MANEVWLPPSRGSPICFHCCQQQPREFPPPTRPRKTCVGMWLRAGRSSEAPPTQRLLALCSSLPVSHLHLLRWCLTSCHVTGTYSSPRQPYRPPYSPNFMISVLILTSLAVWSAPSLNHQVTKCLLSALAERSMEWKAIWSQTSLGLNPGSST